MERQRIKQPPFRPWAVRLWRTRRPTTKSVGVPMKSYIERGGQAGQEVENWLQAERELQDAALYLHKDTSGERPT